MSSRKVNLEDLKLSRNKVLDGYPILGIPDGISQLTFSTALRAYFVALGEKVKISKIGDDELYVRLERT